MTVSKEEKVKAHNLHGGDLPARQAAHEKYLPEVTFHNLLYDLNAYLYLYYIYMLLV